MNLQPMPRKEQVTDKSLMLSFQWQTWLDKLYQLILSIQQGVLVESDPIFNASAAKNIAASDIAAWNAAKTEPIFTTSDAHSIAATDITNWNSKQAGDALLTAISALSASANKLILCTGTDAVSVGALTNAYIDAAAAIARTKLANIATAKILGRGTAGSGSEEELALSSDYGLTFTYTANGLKINTPQDLQTNASPTFANMTDSGLSASQAVMTDGTKKLVSADYLDQAIKTTSNVTHTSVTISRMNFIPSTATLDTNGFVTITSNYAVLDTFEGGATDDLNKITMAGQVAGDLIIICTANNARDITIKNGAVGGNIVVIGGDRLLPNTNRYALLIFNGTNWNVIVCNENAT